MTPPLSRLAQSFENRMKIRRGMLDHLGIDIGCDEAPALQAELRATLLGCARCTNTECCAFWVESARPGLPEFCRARAAFQVLQEHSEREGRRLAC